MNGEFKKLEIAVALSGARPYSWSGPRMGGYYAVTLPPTRHVGYYTLKHLQTIAVAQQDVRLAATVVSIQDDESSR